MPQISGPTVPRPWLLAACLIGVLLPPATRGDGAPDGGPVPSDPVFTALGVDGKTSSGRIADIGADRITLVDAGDARQELPMRSLVKLVRQPRPAAPASGGSHLVLLADGDRLMQVTVTATTETAIEVQSHSALGKLRLPLDTVLALILSPPTEADALDELRERVRAEARTTEVVWLVNGDRITGGFLGLDDRAVKLQIEGKPAEFDRTGVVAVGFDPAALSYPRPPGAFLELTFADGSRLGVSGVTLARGELKGTTRFGQEIHIPITDLARIDPRTESVVPLTEREPDGQSYVSYVGPTLRFRPDATVDGHRLQLGGQVFDRGIGTQSRTLLAYKLTPGDLRFQATVGVDDRAGPLGSVVFRVLVDGQTRFTSPSLGCKDQPRTIDLDVSKSKLLILVTEFGDRGDVRDLADWVEARLIR